jgi:hypothetical protein
MAHVVGVDSAVGKHDVYRAWWGDLMTSPHSNTCVGCTVGCCEMKGPTLRSICVPLSCRQQQELWHGGVHLMLDCDGWVLTQLHIQLC